MNTRVIIIGVIVLVLLGGGYFLLSNRASQQPTPAQTTVESTPADQSEVTPSDAVMKKEGDVKEISVESNGLSFTPNEVTVKEGDTVKVTYKNNKGTHDWGIDEFNVRTKLLNAGTSETVEFVANKKGTFEFYCSVPGHRTAGMKGSLIVE